MYAHQQSCTHGNQLGMLGDILSLGRDAATSMTGSNALGGIKAGNTSGFEPLHLDFTGESDTIDIDALVDALKNQNFTGDNAFEAIVISADEADTILAGSDTWTAGQSGMALEGFDGYYDHYTVNNGLETIEMYVQSNSHIM
ncbi:MAG: hypothetical protein GX776_07730 [Oxalobacter sp.]|nr:hypothetical protein [Oxalobacter sp.]